MSTMTYRLTLAQHRDSAYAAAKAAGQSVTKKGLETKIRARRENRASDMVLRPTVQDRLNRRLLSLYRGEVDRRGWHTTIATRDGETNLAIVSRRDGMTLLHAEGWREYNRGNFRRQSLSYLCGHDDNGPWASRVPGTLTTVSEALAWMIPAAVHAKPASDRLRQGDVWLLRSSKLGVHNADLMPHSHEIVTDGIGRKLVHTPEAGKAHKPVRIPKTWAGVTVAVNKAISGCGD